MSQFTNTSTNSFPKSSRTIFLSLAKGEINAAITTVPESTNSFATSPVLRIFSFRASSVNDKYYTNGFELYYRYLNKNKNPKINKKITEFKLGQNIYNPQTINADDFFVNDRPFAGYLFGRVGVFNYYLD